MLNVPHRQHASHFIERPICDPSPGPTAPLVVALQGRPSSEIQDMLASLASRWTADGLRVAGLVEVTHHGIRKANGGATLRSVHSDEHFELYQDLGPLSTACCLNPTGVANACQAILSQLETCDIAVLSKFGKLEAERGGLFQVFVVAAMQGKPVLTSVAPTFQSAYLSFVGPLGAIVPPDEAYLSAWAQNTRHA